MMAWLASVQQGSWGKETPAQDLSQLSGGLSRNQMVMWSDADHNILINNSQD